MDSKVSNFLVFYLNCLKKKQLRKIKSPSELLNIVINQASPISARKQFRYLGRGEGALGRGAEGVTLGRGEGALGRGAEGVKLGRGEGALGRGTEGVTLGRGEGALGRGDLGATLGRGVGTLGRGTDGVTEGRGDTFGFGTDGRGLLGFTRLGTVPEGVREGKVGEVPGRLGNLVLPLTPLPIVTRDGRLPEVPGRGLIVLAPGVLGIDVEGRLTTRLVVPGAAVGTALAI